MPFFRSAAVSAVGLCALLSPTASAQCEEQWLPSGAFGDLDMQLVLALATHDPDGLGPTPPRLYAGGIGATVQPGQPTRFIMMWDGVSWSPMGMGMDSWVHDLLVLPNGDVIAGGSFTQADGITVNGIARWDGSRWHPMGPGFMRNSGSAGTVEALALMPDGDIVAGGWYFDKVGDLEVKSVARWDGSQWHAMSGGLTTVFGPAAVADLIVEPSGSLIAAGSFTFADGKLAENIARWNGTEWRPLSSSMGWPGGVTIWDLALTADGSIVAGSYPTGEESIFVWDGANWSGVGAGPIGTVYSVFTLPNGDLIAGGEFSYAGSIEVNGIARWNGSEWSALGSGVAAPGNRVYAAEWLTTPGTSGELVAGGGVFTDESSIARWGCGPVVCRADLNGDGLVDFSDYLEFLNLFDGQDPRADFNGDGLVDFSDYLEFLNLYDMGC